MNNLKISKIIKNPFVLLFVWLMYLISPLFDVLRYIYINVMNAPSVSLKYFLYLLMYLFNGGVIMSLFILGIWIKDYSSKEIPSLHKKILITIGSTGVIFVLVSRFLISLELKNYPNYLYSIFGLPYEKLKLMSDLGIVVVIIIVSIFLQNIFSLFRGGKQRVGVAEAAQTFRGNIVIAGLLLLIIWAFFPAIRLNKLIKLSSESYHEKYGIHYKYIPMLAEFVPKDGKIIHPPQGAKWPFIGNQPMIRYFLYPRILISGALVNNQEYAGQIEAAYFAEIDPESSDTHWPIFDQSFRTVIFDEARKITYKEVEIVANKGDINIFKITF